MEGEGRLFRVRPSKYAVKLARRYGYLPYMIERYAEIFGEELIDFLEACEKPPPKSIRCNTLRIDCSLLVERLEAKGFRLSKIPWAPHGFWVEGGSVSLGATEEYLLGYYYIQGAASMLPAYILDPQPGETVLDMAAAPGGKTTQLAQLMGDTGVILAVDVSRGRVRALRSHLNRMGVTNTIVVRTDARRLAAMGPTFDRVLLDAPCTGEGVIPLDPSRKRSRTLKDIFQMARLQEELLEAAALLARPGGHIVYTTCSIAPEENEYVVSRVLERHPELTVVEPKVEVGLPGITSFRGVRFDPRVSRCRRLYPHKHGAEGFVICLLRKH